MLWETLSDRRRTFLQPLGNTKASHFSPAAENSLCSRLATSTIVLIYLGAPLAASLPTWFHQNLKGLWIPRTFPKCTSKMSNNHFAHEKNIKQYEFNSSHTLCAITVPVSDKKTCQVHHQSVAFGVKKLSMDKYYIYRSILCELFAISTISLYGLIRFQLWN